MAETTHIKDESHDEKYFVMTPRLVLYLSRSPFDYTLWNVVKDVAGETKECYISTPDLALMAMMSEGKVSECRKYLIETKLLGGEIRRDPGYPQPVWHLWIPDLWPANLQWCINHASIASRLEWRRGQKEQMAQKEPSPGESSQEPSPGEEGTPPHEGGGSPHEEGTSPHETKNIKKEDSFLKQKEEDSKNQLLTFIWPAIRFQLEGEMRRGDFTQFVAPLVPVSLDGSLTVSASDPRVRDWVQSRLHTRIANLASGIVGYECGFQVVSPETT